MGRRPEPHDAAKVRAYMAKLPPKSRKHLKAIRAAIGAAGRGGVDVISYGIPAIRLDGRIFLWYAAWKTHSSLYPMGTSIRKKFARDLDGYETSKGTIRFPHGSPVPAALIKRLAKARLAEMPARRG